MKDAYDGDAGMVNVTVVALDIWCVRLLPTLSRKPPHSTTDEPTLLPLQCTVKAHRRSLVLGFICLSLHPLIPSPEPAIDRAVVRYIDMR